MKFVAVVDDCLQTGCAGRGACGHDEWSGAVVVAGADDHPVQRVENAVYDAQFVVYNVRGRARPSSGWPADAAKQIIKHDLPYAFPTD
ncbi:hypothetical protein ACFVUS_25150 [Nocardia sp. NPDC058058]|uniref:hypothetical protein n=1 Tax=Nocardia sp. NPDC058058 TaxID=3346317 RepID=UPI0036DDAFF2